jgi:hypothetical protein
MNITFKSAKTALLVAMSLGIGMIGTGVWARVLILEKAIAISAIKNQRLL